MLDDLKEEEIVNRVGGRFKLSTLIQKRMIMLNKGNTSKLKSEENRTRDQMEIVIKEILENKIYLDTEGNLKEQSEILPPQEGAIEE